MSARYPATYSNDGSQHRFRATAQPTAGADIYAFVSQALPLHTFIGPGSVPRAQFQSVRPALDKRFAQVIAVGTSPLISAPSESVWRQPLTYMEYRRGL